MACDFIQHDDDFINYLEGSAKPVVRKIFEEHYFICDDCFKTLQVMEAAITLLHQRGEEIFHGQLPPA